MFSAQFDALDKMVQVGALLRDVSPDFDVPNVVVVGAQSSGKSSVLEHATGLAFPRGEGMCTRVPTVVSVEGCQGDPTLSISVNADFSDEWHPRPVYGDAEAFGRAIEALTDKLTKPGEIGEQPIYIKLRAPKSPTFTLTDVPGITCNSTLVADDVIEAQTVELTRKMIGTHPNTLVLVVLSATEDFATSKALQLARKVDPQGKRTLGVVTKVDSLPAGSHIVRKMSGEEIPLAHGYFAVRNRTQAEVDDDLPMEKLHEREESLFRSHPELSQLPAEQRGMNALLAKIAKEQAKRLDAAVPELRTQIKQRIAETSKRQLKLPPPLGSEHERSQFLHQVLSRVARDFRRCTTSDTTVLGTSCKSTNLSARVNEVMAEFADDTRTNMRNFLDDETKAELGEGAKEALGHNLANFMHGDLFRDIFASNTTPVLTGNSETALVQTRERVGECLLALVSHHVGASGASLQLHESLLELIKDELDQAAFHTRHWLSRLVKAETVVTFTTNHYYSQTIAKFDQIVRDNANGWRHHDYGSYDGVEDGEAEGLSGDFMRDVAHDFNTGTNEASAIRQMQVSLHAYSKVVQKRFVDTVSVLVLNELVYAIADKLSDDALEWSSLLLDQVKEDDSTEHERKKLAADQQRLQKALMLLGKF
jgi:hypothetical protein